MPSSPIRKLVGAAREAEKRGKTVYRLNIGQPDVPTPPQAIEALRHIDRTVLEYSPSEGIESLRVKMSEYYSRFGMEISPEEIIVTSGGSEAVLFAFMACLDPGDEIIIPEPAYANYKVEVSIIAASPAFPAHFSHKSPPFTALKYTGSSAPQETHSNIWGYSPFMVRSFNSKIHFIRRFDIF